MILAYFTGWEGYLLQIPIILILTSLIALYVKKESNKKTEADKLNEQYKRYKNK